MTTGAPAGPMGKRFQRSCDKAIVEIMETFKIESGHDMRDVIKIAYALGDTIYRRVYLVLPHDPSYPREILDEKDWDKFMAGELSLRSDSV